MQAYRCRKEGKMLSPKPVEGDVLLSFPDAMREVIKGNRVTRTSWNDDSEYGILADFKLTIHAKGAFHPWLVNDGDLQAIDWIVLEKN